MERGISGRRDGRFEEPYVRMFWKLSVQLKHFYYIYNV